MGSRSRKIISMVPIQHNNLIENRTLVETWLENYDSENQLNDHSYSFESSHPSINNVPSSLDGRKTDSITENHANEGDGEIISTDTVNVNATLQNTEAKNIPGQDISLNDNDIEIPSDNNEDVYASDGSEYEPLKKKPYKKVYPSDHNSSNSDSSSSSSSSSSSGSTSNGSSSSKSNSNVSIARHNNLVPETIEPNNDNVAPEIIEPSTHNVVPEIIEPSTHNVVPETIEPSTHNDVIPQTIEPSTISKSKKKDKKPKSMEKKPKKRFKK